MTERTTDRRMRRKQLLPRWVPILLLVGMGCGEHESDLLFPRDGWWEGDFIAFIVQTQGNEIGFQHLDEQCSPGGIQEVCVSCFYPIMNAEGEALIRSPGVIGSFVDETWAYGIIESDCGRTPWVAEWIETLP